MKYLLLVLSVTLCIQYEAKAGLSLDGYSKLVGIYYFHAKASCPKSVIEKISAQVDSCVGKTSLEMFNLIFDEDLGAGERDQLDMIVENCYQKSTGVNQSELKHQCGITFFWDHDFKHGDDSNVCPGPNDVTKAYCKQMEEKLEHDKLNIP